MPSREDERWLNLSSKHPAACRCQNCTDKFLNQKAIKAKKPPKNKRGVTESVKRHPADCPCASCSLLKSMDSS